MQGVANAVSNENSGNFRTKASNKNGSCEENKITGPFN